MMSIRTKVTRGLLAIAVGIFGVALWLSAPGILNRVAERGFEQVVDDVMPSVVHVTNESMRWQGSGVALTEDIVLTARHVAEKGSNFVVTLNNGESYTALHAISSKKYDMGFIKLAEPVLTPAKFSTMEDCRLGTTVFVVGSPYGKMHFNSVTLGIISGLERNIDDFVAQEGYPNSGWPITFTTDAAGHPGNSGCPVFTMDGKVRGILVAGFSPVLIHVVPADTVINDLAQIEILFTLNEYYIEETPEFLNYYRYWEEEKNPRLPIWEQPFPKEPYNRSPFIKPTFPIDESPRLPFGLEDVKRN